MNSSALYDLSPLARMMLAGVGVALLPLAWLAWRQRQAGPAQRLRALTMLTLFLTFDLVLFGAFTRLTDSGLGCPDWPGCYGHASPLGASASIAAAQEVQPTGPVTHGKAWVEMIHRYLATGVGVLIVTLTALSWRWRGGDEGIRSGGPGPGWPAFTLAWVLLQGAFGALTVTMKLFPAIVTLHLLGGLILLALLSVQASQHQLAAGPRGPQALAPGLRAGLWGVAALVVIQVALGGWVSTNYAVLACQDFPQCQGHWWPDMDWRNGFTLWRPLGVGADGTAIPFAALTAIHYAHRLAAFVVLAALALLAWRLWRSRAWPQVARALALLALWQLATGLSNVVLGWPLLAAVAHTAGAAALVAVLSWALAASHTVSARGLVHPPHPSGLPA